MTIHKNSTDDIHPTSKILSCPWPKNTISMFQSLLSRLSKLILKIDERFRRKRRSIKGNQRLKAERDIVKQSAVLLAKS